MGMRDLEIALRIGANIINKMPKSKPLEGEYLKLYNEYIKMIKEDEKHIRTSWGDDKDMQTCALDDLDNEKLHAECVFSWLQENTNNII